MAHQTLERPGVLRGDVLATDKTRRHQRREDRDLQTSPPALSRMRATGGRHRHRAADRRVVVEDVGSWHPETVRTGEQQVNLPSAAPRLVSEVVPGAAHGPRLVLLCLDEHTEPLANALPPPQPVGAHSSLVSLAVGVNAGGGSSACEHDLGERLLVRREPRSVRSGRVALRRTAGGLEVIPEHGLVLPDAVRVVRPIASLAPRMPSIARSATLDGCSLCVGRRSSASG